MVRGIVIGFRSKPEENSDSGSLPRWLGVKQRNICMIELNEY